MASVRSAAVPDGEPGAGSSMALLQRWVHDLEAFEALDADAKDQIIGRRLRDGEEIDESHRSPAAHRMVGLDGPRDHLTNISRCTASAWYAAPPVEAFTSA